MSCTSPGAGTRRATASSTRTSFTSGSLPSVTTADASAPRAVDTAGSTASTTRSKPSRGTSSDHVCTQAGGTATACSSSTVRW